MLMELLPVGSAAGRIASCADVSPSSSSYSSSSIFGVQPSRWCSERSRVAASGSGAAVVPIRSSSDPRRRSMFGRRSATARPHLRVLMDTSIDSSNPFRNLLQIISPSMKNKNVILAQ